MLPIPLSDVDSTTVLVKWNPRYDGMSPIREYTLQYNKQPDGWKDYLSNLTGRVEIDASFTSLLVTRLWPSSSYSFRVKATNDIGDSAWSESSNTVLTHPDGTILLQSFIIYLRIYLFIRSFIYLSMYLVCCLVHSIEKLFCLIQPQKVLREIL